MRFFRRSLIGLFLLALTAGILAIGGNTVYSALQARWSGRAVKQAGAGTRLLGARAIN